MSTSYTRVSLVSLISLCRRRNVYFIYQGFIGFIGFSLQEEECLLHIPGFHWFHRFLSAGGGMSTSYTRVSLVSLISLCRRRNVYFIYQGFIGFIDFSLQEEECLLHIPGFHWFH